MTNPTAIDVFTALNPEHLLPVFILFLPFILGIIATLISISLIKWGIKTVAEHVSLPDAVPYYSDNNVSIYGNKQAQNRKLPNGRDW